MSALTGICSKQLPFTTIASIWMSMPCVSAYISRLPATFDPFQFTYQPNHSCLYVFVCVVFSLPVKRRCCYTLCPKKVPVQVEAADWVKSRIGGIHLTESGAYSGPRVSPLLSHSDRWLDLVTVANLNRCCTDLVSLFWYIL